MTAAMSDTLVPGTEVGCLTVRLTREQLVRYAGASGDFNPIHYSDHFATALGLPGVIAHGMLTMGTALRVVTDWVGDPGAVLSYGVRFSKPVVVPDDDEGTVLTVSGRVEDKLDGGRVVVGLTATTGEGTKVLMGAKAVVRLP